MSEGALQLPERDPYGSSAMDASLQILSGRFAVYASHLTDEAMYPDMDRTARTADGPGQTDADPRPAPLREVVREPQPMSVADIRAILEARNASTPQTRIASLMWYAFHFDSPDNKPYRPLPELANDVATNDRTTLEWLQGRETRRDKTRFEKIDNLLKADQRRELEDFMDDTDYLRDEYEWVANADRIRRMMPLHREAVFVEVAVRQLILEAEAETAGNTPEN